MYKLKQALQRRLLARLPQHEQQAELKDALHMLIWPNRWGWALLALLLVMFVWSTNHRINMGYALVFFVFISVALSALLTVNNLSGLRLRCLEPRDVFLGEVASFPFLLTETQGRMRVALRLSANGARSAPLILPANTEYVAQVNVPSVHRGWLYLDVVNISTDYPLGLMHSWYWLKMNNRVLVYPRPAGELPLPLQGGRQESNPASVRGGVDEFTQLRPYQAGDSLKSVAWKKSIQGDQWMVKQFSGTGSEYCAVDYHLAQGDVEERLSQMCQWILQAQAQGTAYALHLPGQFIAADKGREHQRRCLRQLALFNSKTPEATR